MPTPPRRVILYRNGLRSKTGAQYHNEANLKKPEYFECPACKRAVKKGENGNLKRHFADFKNKIKCKNGLDKQS